MRTQKAPSHLKAAGKAYFSLLVESFDIAEHQRPLVVLASELLDRATACRKAIDREGETRLDRFNQLKPHPLLSAERDARSLFLTTVRQLGLDGGVPGSDQSPPMEI